jgi:hypothetical protein
MNINFFSRFKKMLFGILVLSIILVICFTLLHQLDPKNKIIYD